MVQQRSVVRLAKRGAAAPITAIETQTQVANFQSQVFSALQTVSELQTQLKSLIVADPADPIWSANLVPSSPVQELPSAGDLAAIVALAENERPEVRQVMDQRRVAEPRHGLCQESSASPGRPGRPVLQQRLRGHLAARS